MIGESYTIKDIYYGSLQLDFESTTKLYTNLDLETLHF